MELDTCIIREMLSNIVEPLVGDMPVAAQLEIALRDVAQKKDVDALSAELGALRKAVEKLVGLVGDIPVAAQIEMAANKPEN